MKNEMPSPYYRQVQMLRHRGRTLEAAALVHAVNSFQRAFGHPPYDDPPPLPGVDLPNLVTAPAKGGPRHGNA